MRSVILCALVIGCAHDPIKQEPPATAASMRGVRVETLRPPSKVPTRDRELLVYEITITPSASGAVTVTRIAVDDLILEGAALTSVMFVRGPDHRRVMPLPTSIAPDQRAVYYLMHSYPRGTQGPSKLAAAVTLRYADATTETVALEVPVLDIAPVVIGAPLAGGPWLAFNGISNTSIHRRTVPPVPEMHVPERFAIDYILADDTGLFARAPRDKNADFLCYGRDLLAVGDGTIVKLSDGQADNKPGMTPDPSTLTADNVGGNILVLKLDTGPHVFYAHIQPAGFKVALGDHVSKGQVLAVLGNSGNSSAPHLHLHVSDREHPVVSESVPYVLERFTYLGNFTDPRFDMGYVDWGKQVKEPQERVLPAEDEAFTF